MHLAWPGPTCLASQTTCALYLTGASLLLLLCSELAKRKAGEPGTFILDDPTKYPAKDDIGFFGE